MHLSLQFVYKLKKVNNPIVQLYQPYKSEAKPEPKHKQKNKRKNNEKQFREE